MSEHAAEINDESNDESIAPVESINRSNQPATVLARCISVHLSRHHLHHRRARLLLVQEVLEERRGAAAKHKDGREHDDQSRRDCGALRVSGKASLSVG